MNQRAWGLFSEAEQASNRVWDSLEVGDRADVQASRRKARVLGLPIPPSTEECEGIRSRSRSSQALWEGDLAAAQGNGKDAIQRYQEAAETESTMRPMALARMALLYHGTGDKAQAVDAYREAIDAVEAFQGSLRLESLVASWASRQAPLYIELIGLLHDLGQPELGFEYAERARARAFLNQIGNRRLPAAAVPSALSAELYGVRQKLIELESFRKKPPREGMMAGLPGPGDADRRLEEEATRRRYEELLGRLAQANPEYVSLVQVNTASLGQVQREILPANSTLVEYFVLNDKMLAWVIDREHVQWVELKMSAKTLHEKVAHWRDLTANRLPQAQVEAGLLHEALIAPLEPYFEHTNLIIVSHGALHYLPFNALWSNTKQRYLIEDYTVTMAPSASALRFVLGKKKPPVSNVLALGNPDGSLPRAESEARAAATIFRSSPWLRKDARESRLRQEAARAGVVHLAAHARYDPVRPLFTRIELAADEDAAARGEPADGALHVYEVFDLDLKATQLVVLSACETALGARDEGDDLIGLTRAFLYAGARSVVTTLWSIDDESSAALMASFYRRLRGGVAAAQALREAQLEILRRDEWREPHFWAAFALTGDGGALAVQ